MGALVIYYILVHSGSATTENTLVLRIDTGDKAW